MNPLERIIWSADVADEVTLMAALDLMPSLRIVKMDALFFEDRDLSTIDRLNERGIRVFDDRKAVEIPSKLEAIAMKHLAHRPWMLNCMAGAISSNVLTNEDRNKLDGLKRFADACHKVGTKPCGVTVLTSKKPDIISGEFNGRDSIEQVLYYVDRLMSCGFTDIVCSVTEVEAIRLNSTFDVLDLNVPGIRPLWVATGDQVRIGTPSGAIASGATRLVIGRPITEGTPAKNLQRIVDEISALT